MESELCDICSKIVADNDDGLLCEECLIWKHRACLQMAKKTYDKISKSNEKWICNGCKNRNNAANPATTRVTGNDYTLADVMAKLNEMDNKYQTLFVRYTEQVQINDQFKAELKQIKSQLNVMEQRELNNNIIIHGIPYQKNESVNETIKKVGKQLDLTIADQQFTAMRIGRIETKNCPIRVTLANEELKTKIMKSPKKLKLDTGNIGFAAGGKIFINHDLTKSNLELHKAAREFKVQNQYKYLWIQKGKIMLRKDDTSRIILVEDKEDLKN